MRFEHRKLSSGGAVYTHYLQAGGQTVGLYESTAITGGTPGAKGFKYLHRDHLGSVDTVTHFDSTLYATAVLARYSYDLWGKRRNADWTDASAPIVANETIRGYTGHEMLDTVGLVHMNGRVYDAELGRMLSADPFVPEAVNPQAFNRYSYVLNNPLSYTDPSGFFFKKLFKAVVKVFKKVFEFIASIPIIRKIAPYVVASFCGPAAAACAAVVAGGLEAASGGSIFDIMTAAYSAASGFGTFLGDAGQLDYDALFLDAVADEAKGGGFSSGSGGGGDSPRTVDERVAHQAAVLTAGGNGQAGLGGGKFGNPFRVQAGAQKESYWDAFADKWNERVDQITGAADNALDYWIEQDNPLMGTLAATFTSGNIGNTTFNLTAGAALAPLGGSAFLNSGAANLLVKYPGLLRLLPQGAVRGTLNAAGWASGTMRGTTAARGGWSMG